MGDDEYEGGPWGLGRVRVSVRCRLAFRMKLWCGSELGFGFRLSVRVIVID